MDRTKIAHAAAAANSPAKVKKRRHSARTRTSRPSDLPLDLSPQSGNESLNSDFAQAMKTRKLTHNEFLNALNNGSFSADALADDSHMERWKLDLDRMSQEYADAEDADADEDNRDTTTATTVSNISTGTGTELTSQSGALVLHNSSSDSVDHSICKLSAQKTQLDHRFDFQEKVFAYKTNEVKMQNQHLETRHQLVTSLTAQISHRLVQIKEKDHELLLLDGLNHKVTKDLAKVEKTIENKHKRLNELDQKLEEKSKIFDAKFKEWGDLAKTLAEKDEEVARLDEQLAGKRQEFADKEASWKATELKYAKMTEAAKETSRAMGPSGLALAVQELNSALPTDMNLLGDIEDIILKEFGQLDDTNESLPTEM